MKYIYNRILLYRKLLGKESTEFFDKSDINMASKKYFNYNNRSILGKYYRNNHYMHNHIALHVLRKLDIKII